MKRLTFWLRREPIGDTYKRLIELGSAVCPWAQVVVPKGATPTLEMLDPFIDSRSVESEWPGTKLVQGTAEVYRFRLCRESVTVLETLAEGLYSWRHPDHPEDLCFLRADGQPWLASISHERQGYLILSAEERVQILKELPELGPLVAEETIRHLVPSQTDAQNQSVHLFRGDDREIGELRHAAMSSGFHWFQMDASGVTRPAHWSKTFSQVLGASPPITDDWRSLQDHLCDLSWLPGRWYVYLIEHAERYLVSAPAEDCQTFMQLLCDVAEYWWWNYRVPCHFLLTGGTELLSSDFGHLQDQLCIHSGPGELTGCGN